MKRVSKNPDERKEEIINASRTLFIHNGFANTKISDIVKKINVSQGVFYYYFSSKEDIIDEIVDRYIKKLTAGAVSVLQNRELSGIQKLEQMSDKQLKINMSENSNIHAIKGVDIHERILRRLVLDYVPLMAEAFNNREREDKKEYRNRYVIEIFVAAANVLFDPGIFSWNKEERNNRISFLISFMENSLGVERGSLGFYKKLMGFAG